MECFFSVIVVVSVLIDVLNSCTFKLTYLLMQRFSSYSKYVILKTFFGFSDYSFMFDMSKSDENMYIIMVIYIFSKMIK